MVAVSGLLWISWCVLVRREFVFFLFFFLRTHTACCEYEAALAHLRFYYKYYCTIILICVMETLAHSQYESMFSSTALVS